MSWQPTSAELLACLFGVSIFAAPAAMPIGAIPELGRARDFRLCPASELKEEPAADLALAELLEDCLARKETAAKGIPGYVKPGIPNFRQVHAAQDRADSVCLKNLLEFAEAHRTASASIKAMFVVARSIENIYSGHRKEGVIARKIYSEILDKHPQSVEGRLSACRVSGLQVGDLMDMDGEKGIRSGQCMSRMGELLVKARETHLKQDSLFERLDADHSRVGVAFRALYFPSGRGSFLMSNRIDLGTIAKYYQEQHLFDICVP